MRSSRGIQFGRTVIRFIGHDGGASEDSVQVPPLWAGQSDGDDHLPGLWRESYRCISTVWQGTSAECHGSAAECPDYQDIPCGCSQSQHQPVCCGTVHSSGTSGCSWRFRAQSVRMALFGW